MSITETTSIKVGRRASNIPFDGIPIDVGLSIRLIDYPKLLGVIEEEYGGFKDNHSDFQPTMTVEGAYDEPCSISVQLFDGIRNPKSRSEEVAERGDIFWCQIPDESLPLLIQALQNVLDNKKALLLGQQLAAAGEKSDGQEAI